MIVFSNMLSGLRADLMLVWAKNGYEQNLVLKQNPPPPSSFGLSSSTTTLQFWTAMDSCPVPQEQRPAVLDSGLVDHILIFGSSWLPVGAAFMFGNTPLPSAGQPTPINVIRPSDPGTVPVAKSRVSIAGQQVLIEEVSYTGLSGALSQLPLASVSPNASQTLELAERATFLKATPKAKPVGRPMQVALKQYSTKGVVLDYPVLSGGASSFTFTNGTYYIPANFSVGPNSVTFQANACVKFGSSWLMVYGPLSFPGSGQVVFTSKDDNSYGLIITNSTANPQYAAGQELWIYYPTFSTTVKNSLFRWAQRGVEYDENAPDHYGHNLSSSVFQDCSIGVYMNMQSDTLTLASDSYCNVVTPVDTDQYHGTVNGSMTADCGVVSVAMVNDPNRDTTGLDTNKNSQSECSFAVLDSTNIVAAFMNTHLSEYGLGASGQEPISPAFPAIPSPRMTSWAVSRNSGASFTDNGPLLPVSTITNGSTIITNGAPNPTLGDAGDTCMAYDSQSNVVYLLVNPSREPGYQGARLWTSNNKGTNFTLINTNVPNSTNIDGLDGPRIKLISGGNLYVTGGFESGGENFRPYTQWIARSTNGGTAWDPPHGLETNNANGGARVLQTPDGTIYAFWLYYIGNSTTPPVTNRFGYAWLSGGTWSSSRQLPISINSPYGGGSGRPLRFNGDDTNDWFLSNAAEYPVFASTNIYLVWADLPTTNSATDHGDIFLAELNTNSDHSLSLSTIRKVNNDRTSTDQWNPSIAVSPAGTELFIGYYSRQEDPVTNSWIRAYGAKVYVASGLANATFECFPIGLTRFLPLYAGTNVADNNWAFDPVWPAACVCLDTNGAYATTNSCDVFYCPAWPNSIVGFSTLDDVQNFCADDYTWAASDNSYFYFAWCDRSRSFGNAPTNRPDADINFAKIKQ